MLFVLVIRSHVRLRPVRIAATESPTSEWVARPIAAFPRDSASRRLLEDRDGTYGEKFSGAARWLGIRFGKMLLDEPGLSDFKRTNRWLADVDTLPFTQIYVGGERWKDFAGGGVEQLQRRLERLRESAIGPSA